MIRTWAQLRTLLGGERSTRGDRKDLSPGTSIFTLLRDTIDSLESIIQNVGGILNVDGIVTSGETPLLMEDTVWDDLRFPATAINPPGQVADPDFDTTNIGWLFDPGATEILYLVAQLPHSYKEGTNLSCHVHWNATNTNAGNVLWRISYRWRNNGEVGGAFADVDIVAAASGTAGLLQVNEFIDLIKVDATISSILDIKLQRIGGDGTDTYNADALLKEFDIHFELNTIGSKDKFVK